ncbi:MAG: hypothetical protein HDT28_08330 [Clostridiales bacterium]|nr:hypothetical protein [Clostridiales bacterium]
MGKKGNSKSVLGFVFAALILVGLVLVIVGMFVGQVAVTTSSKLAGTSETKMLNLFDGDVWGVEEVLGKKVGVSNVFGIISFIVAVVGAVILAIDCVLNVFLGKNVKIIRFVGIAVTFVGAVLVLVAGLVMASQCGEYLSLDWGSLAEIKYTAGVGVWLGFIGGLVAAVAGGLSLAFNK